MRALPTRQCSARWPHTGAGPRRTGWRRACFGIALAVALALPAAALEVGPAQAIDDGAAALHVSSEHALPLAATDAAVPTGGVPVASVAATRTMLWHSHSRMSLGVGVEQLDRRPALSAPFADASARSDSVLVGVGLDTSRQSRLSWQAPLAGAAASGIDAPRQMRVGLSFSTRDPYQDLRRGMLTRVELSGQTTLSIRPRGGRLALTLTSRW